MAEMAESTIENVKLSGVRSKYISPCRTFGLRRKSVSPIINDVNRTVADVGSKKSTVNAKLRKTDQKMIGDTPKRYKLASVKKKIETHLTIQKNQPVVLLQRLNLDQLDMDNKNIYRKCLNNKEQKPELGSPNLDKSDGKFMAIIERINRKTERLDGLKRTNVYTKKHDLVKLQALTEKWKTACREILPTLVNMLKSNGKNITMSDILMENNIPYDLIGYNEQTMDFD